MRARKVYRQAVKPFLVVLCLTLIMAIHLGCSVIGIEHNNATPAGVNDNPTVLSILDVSDLQNARLLSSITLPSSINNHNNVLFSKGYAYTTTSDGLHIINLSNPQNLKIVASVALPGEINQVRLFQNYLYIGSDQGLHTVDVSKPHQPVVMRTGGPEAYESMPVRDINLHGSYAYVMDTNHYLHVLDLADPIQPRLIRSETVYDYWLLGVRADGANVQLIQLPNSPSFSPEIWGELLNRKNLLEFHGWFDKMRVSADHLVYVDSRSWQSIAFARRSHSPMRGEFKHFYPGPSYLAHLYLSEKRKINNRTPTHAAIMPNSVVLMEQDKWSKTVSVPDNLLGKITEIQLFGKALCATSSNGVFLVVDAGEDENYRVLSAVDLPPHRPISLAIDGSYACVMGVGSK